MQRCPRLARSPVTADVSGARLGSAQGGWRFSLHLAWTFACRRLQAPLLKGAAGSHREARPHAIPALFQHVGNVASHGTQPWLPSVLPRVLLPDIRQGEP